MYGTITGAFAPVPTPLDRVGRVDVSALVAHLEWLIHEGLDGALILGTNGEFPSLSLADRLLVAEVASAVSDRLSLLLGVGSCALPDVLRMVDAAADLGYIGILVPPPFYFRNAPREGIAKFIHSVVEHARLPALLYHIPQLTGIAFDDDLMRLIGRPDGLVGVKDSSGAHDDMRRLIDWFDGGSYLVGTDRLVSESLRHGGSGSISAAASVVPGLVMAVSGDDRLQPQLDRVRTLLESFGLGAAVKAILARRGLGDYASRPPLASLSPDRAADLFREWDLLSETSWPGRR
jgi:4-hydroxy-tetrahydrodipicolinate synthase